jgi:nucleoside 2-deoxyribosyltransferase
MNIYFAGSITGGREDAPIYLKLIDYLKTKGVVLTEHLGSSNLLSTGEDKSPEYIYLRDVNWIKEADIVIAEVTKPSLGVGYEIGLAENLNKKIICLYRENDDNKDKMLSKMISGNKYNTIIKYKTIDEIILILNKLI